MSEDRHASQEQAKETPAPSAASKGGAASRGGAASKGGARVTVGIFVGILLVLAFAGACVIGWFGKDVRDRIRPPTATPSSATPWPSSSDA